MNIPLQKSEIMLTKEFNIKNLKDLYSNNIMIKSVKRNGKKLEDETEMKNGDVLELIGPKHAISKIEKSLDILKLMVQKQMLLI